jgi:hypothetical protein
MIPSDNDPSDRPKGRTAAALHQIANALGCSVDVFFEKSSIVSGTESADELIRLWNELPDTQARRRILAQIRREVDRHGGRSDPGVI